MSKDKQDEMMEHFVFPRKLVPPPDNPRIDGECVHCGGYFEGKDHWKDCEKHPANERIEKLQSALRDAMRAINTLVINANSDELEELGVAAYDDASDALQGEIT
jgi:hypothetical protein